MGEEKKVNNSKLLSGKIWIPQIECSESLEINGTVARALQYFCHDLFEIPGTEMFVGGNSYSAITGGLFDLTALVNYLEQHNKSISVFGTFSQEEIIEHSYRELGFNIFDLGGKLFKYIPLNPSPDANYLKKLLSCDIIEIPDKKYRELIQLLKWTRCHQFTKLIQEAVGHGNRDVFQFRSCKIVLDQLKRVIAENKDKCHGLPCCEGCQILRQIDKIAAKFQKIDNKKKEEPCPELAREIAFLDCRKYRIAQSKHLLEIQFPQKTETRKKFKRIIILENNEGFKNQLKKDLHQFLEKDGCIIEAHPERSWQNCSLCDTEGKDFLEELIYDKKIEPSSILCCIDLDLGEQNIPKIGMGHFMKSTFGGQWILYKNTREYPKVPRVVITGYRSQDLLSYIAGGNAFLMKPYTLVELKKQIDNARSSIRSRVMWLCPGDAQENYYSFCKSKPEDFKKVANLLNRWLDGHQVDLEIKEDVKAIENIDLIILDIFKLKNKYNPRELMSKTRKLSEIISKIRSENPTVSIILVLPFELDREMTVSDFYRQLPLNLRDGSDNVIRKPFWFVFNERSKPEDCLGNMIISQLANKEDFDVKYQVLVPIVPIVGRLANSIKDIKDNPGQKSFDKLYAPLLPYLINCFGLSARIMDIKKTKTRTELEQELKEKITDEINNEPERWENIDLEDVDTIISSFVKQIDDFNIKRHTNLESWLRYMVETNLNEGDRKDIHTLTEPLARVFGGSTRFELGVRGSWYEGTARIDDIIIVVEFCAKSSILGRKFIRDTAVNYLLGDVGREYAVLVQELPIKGFLCMKKRGQSKN